MSEVLYLVAKERRVERETERKLVSVEKLTQSLAVWTAQGLSAEEIAERLRKMKNEYTTTQIRVNYSKSRLNGELGKVLENLQVGESVEVEVEVKAIRVVKRAGKRKSK